MVADKQDLDKPWHLVSSPHQQVRRSNKRTKVTAKAPPVSVHTTTIGTSAPAMGLIYHHSVHGMPQIQTTTTGAAAPPTFNTGIHHMYEEGGGKLLPLNTGPPQALQVVAASELFSNVISSISLLKNPSPPPILKHYI